MYTQIRLDNVLILIILSISVQFWFRSRSLYTLYRKIKSRRNWNSEKGVEEMGIKTVGEVGIDEMESYRKTFQVYLVP